MLTTAYIVLNRFGARIDRLTAWLVGIIVLLMFSSLFLQVISRYCFDAPLSWPEEVTMFLMAWMSFSGPASPFADGDISALIFFSKNSQGGRIVVCSF